MLFMRKAFALLSFFFALTFPAFSASFPVVQKNFSAQKISVNETPPKNISSLKVKDLEKLAGRKFSLKEKLAFFILKKQLKHEDKGSKDGKTAFAFGLAAISFLILGLFIPYIFLGSLVAAIVAVVVGSSALRENPNDRKAHSGRLLGWITLGLIALLLILIAIALSSSSWW